MDVKEKITAIIESEWLSGKKIPETLSLATGAGVKVTSDCNALVGETRDGRLDAQDVQTKGVVLTTQNNTT